MEGGELFQRIQDRQDGAFTERGKKIIKYNVFLILRNSRSGTGNA